MIFVKALSYEEWLKWQTGGLGGSTAAVIMGVSPWETRNELWQRRTGRMAPQEQTYPMRRGLRLEPEARLEYELRTGILMPRQLGMHERHSHLRGSYDGFNRDLPRISEFKCPGREAHGKACAGEVPEHYVWQCVHLMYVADLNEIDYFSYDKKTTALITIERDSKLETQYLREAHLFWSYIQDDVEPPDQPTIRKAVKAKAHGKWDFAIRRRAAR